MDIEKKFNTIEELQRKPNKKINYSKKTSETQFLNSYTTNRDSEYRYNTLQAFFSETSFHWFSELNIKSKFLLEGKLTNTQEGQLNSLNEWFIILSQQFAKYPDPILYVAKQAKSIRFILSIGKLDMNEKTPDLSKFFHVFNEKIIIKRDRYIFNFSIEDFFQNLEEKNIPSTIKLGKNKNV